MPANDDERSQIVAKPVDALLSSNHSSDALVVVPAHVLSDSTGPRELYRTHRSHPDLRLRKHFSSASSTTTGWVLLLVYIIRTTAVLG
jgi:hypothetical protein